MKIQIGQTQMKTIIVLLVMFLTFNVSYSQKKYVRYNANSPQGMANIEAMNKAFQKLRTMDCSNGLSWYYQGAIHNIPNLIEGNNKLCSLYQTSSDKLFAWGDCTHKNSESSSLNFLLWHRMYTWHLEKIVRALSGKTDFAMPYWNYGQDNTMPSLFSNQKTSLYEPARYTVLNNNLPIPDSLVVDINEAIEDLRTNPIFSGSGGFSSTLNATPHGFMHDLIGGDLASQTFYNEIYQRDMSGLMANVPSAGFDPIFWLHHSMVDRIWASWDVSPNGKRPTLAELVTYPWQYNFIEPDGSKVTYTMEQVYNNVFNLDYEYDNLLYQNNDAVLASNKSLKTMEITSQNTEQQTIWEQKIEKTLGSEDFVHKVVNKFSKKTNKVFLSSANSDTYLFLNLDVIVYKEPSDYYVVYLRYPGENDKYIGKMTFFGVGHEHGTGENNALAENGVALKFSYHISDDLKATNKPFEVIIKKNGTGNAKVTLEKMSLTLRN